MEHTIPNLDPQLKILSKRCFDSGQIDPALYDKHGVKRGLREPNGKGVLTGLTEISDVNGTKWIDGGKVSIEGELFYQGYNVHDLVKGFSNRCFGFEETIYLLLFGELPNMQQFSEFVQILSAFRVLPDKFTRDVIMKAPTADMMNTLQRSVLTLFSYDDRPDDLSTENVLRQSLQLIAQFPLISLYGYQAYRHYYLDKSLIIRRPKMQLSTAENMLRLLRPDGEYTELEAKVLDVALVLHAEHGGGNNSTFTTHVVSSTGTDTYSAISASLGSLRGPRHGGANIKVHQMFADLKQNVQDWEDEAQVKDYLAKLLNKQAFDKSGLIYGMGHAVYTLSDPRAVILKKFARELSEEKGLTREFALYERVERLATEMISQNKNLPKAVCANVDFYSGFVYTMLGLPQELFTPIFAIARIPGWCAHRMEEIVNAGKIIRPAYQYVGTHRDYVRLSKRD
ncbi:MAG: citrate/2-methylcitrate synthase [Lachnospiraceae bacterium]|nr:citrate/2-methylcitrate synthase [Lachnospiraceae bacterium]